MTSATEHLVGLVEAEDRYDIPHAKVLPIQLEAANERLQSRMADIPLLANRAERGGVVKVQEPSDLVTLLFAHTTYKSYSEGWLTEGRWDRMGKWLQTVSTYPVEGVDPGGVQSLEDWLKRLEASNHFVACSSGTTGRPAMLSSSEADLAFTGRTSVASFSWATGIKPEGDRKLFGLGPRTGVTRNLRIRQAMIDAFASREEPFPFPGEPITVSSVMEMIALRRRIADGTARPAEIAEFEGLSTKRQTEMDAAISETVDALIDSRDLRLLVTGMFGTLHPIAEMVREKGYGGTDFRPGNALLTGGGLKGTVLPPDYREYVLDTFNVTAEHVYHLYSMQELNTPFPMCGAGRYHVAPWVIVLPLDESGEQLLDASGGEIAARAAFFDISLDGRWGGVISGDRITVDFGSCRCGHEGPTIGREITRYADLPGGDKISCAGTIDAYVRGVA
jgi:hypothetical protein